MILQKSFWFAAQETFIINIIMLKTAVLLNISVEMVIMIDSLLKQKFKRTK